MLVKGVSSIRSSSTTKIIVRPGFRDSQLDRNVVRLTGGQLMKGSVCIRSCSCSMSSSSTARLSVTGVAHPYWR